MFQYIDALGWVCTALVIIGYVFNAKQKTAIAFTIWIIGDLGWIVYDYYIDNWSHATLSTLIIIINLYGLYNRKRIKRRQEENN